MVLQVIPQCLFGWLKRSAQCKEIQTVDEETVVSVFVYGVFMLPCDELFLFPVIHSSDGTTNSLSRSMARDFTVYHI